MEREDLVLRKQLFRFKISYIYNNSQELTKHIISLTVNQLRIQPPFIKSSTEVMDRISN